MRFGWAGVAQSLFSHSETFSLSSKLLLIFLIPLCRLVYIFSYFFTSSLLHTIEEYKRKSMKKKGMKNWFRLCRRLSSVRERSLLVKDIFSVFFSINSFSSMLFFYFLLLCAAFSLLLSLMMMTFFSSLRLPFFRIYVAMMTTTTT